MRVVPHPTAMSIIRDTLAAKATPELARAEGAYLSSVEPSSCTFFCSMLTSAG
jgi:hypothetical protein